MLAEYFNEFFTNIGSNLEHQIPRSSVDPLSYVNAVNRDSFFLYPISVEECSVIISNLKNTGQGRDSVPVWLWKKIKDNVALPISVLINSCFSEGKFPEILKIAMITAAHKKGVETDVNNFRPISILILISKIIEKCIYCRLLKFSDKNSILSPDQFGFRPGRSTFHALSRSTEFIYEAMNNKKNYHFCKFRFKKGFRYNKPHNFIR